jgi:hypothetical protein
MESLNEVKFLQENIKEKQSSTRYTEKKYGSKRKMDSINLINTNRKVRESRV